MPVPDSTSTIQITPMVHDPKETKVRFGATVTGVDLNDIDGQSGAPPGVNHGRSSS